MTLLFVGSAVALLAWLGLLLSPHQPHRVRERLDADPDAADDLSAVTVLVPARDEAELIGRTIAALGVQGRGLDVVVIDDQSSDDTCGAALRAAASNMTLRVLAGQPVAAAFLR
jgi:hypothetical protein